MHDPTRGPIAYERYRELLREESEHSIVGGRKGEMPEFKPDPQSSFEELHPALRLVWERLAQEIAASVGIPEAKANEESRRSSKKIKDGWATRLAGVK